MNNTVSGPVPLSSLRRLGILAGMPVLCVLLNFLIVNILPLEWQTQIYGDMEWVSRSAPGSFLLWGVVVAPAWETLFQGLPALMLGKSPSRARVVFYLFASAIPFAGIHAVGYSVLYAVLLLPVAFILAWVYYYFRQRNQMPYLMTAIVHGLINLISYLFWLA